MGAARIPKAVNRALIEKWPLYWLYYDGGLYVRTVPSGYGLYAKTGIHENGRVIERKLYIATTKERARELSSALDEALGSNHVSRSLEQLIWDLRH